MNDNTPLLTLAKQARQFAYAPYSHFSVGAALLADDGTVFLGCNIENASLGVTCCAERTALFKAISKGVRRFSAIAVVGAPIGEDPVSPCPPCGLCRQALAEFCGDELTVILGEQEQTTLGKLLPHAFRMEVTPRENV